MKKILCFAIVLLCLSVPASAADLPKFDTFKNTRGDVTVVYPEGWHVKEVVKNNPYQIFISREKLIASDSKFQVGMTFAKFYNNGWYMDFKPNDREKYYSLVLEATKKPDSPVRIIKEERIQLAGVEALLVEQKGVLVKDMIHMFYLYVLKDDVGMFFCLEAPEDEFENYRDTFRQSITNSTFFVTDGKDSDNTLLMNEASNLVAYEMQRQMKEGMDFEAMSKIFDEAAAMSPANGTLYSLIGGYMFHMAKASDDEYKTQMGPQVIELLKLSEKYYDKHPGSYDEAIMKFYRSQNNYLIADTYQYFLRNKADAKPYYEKSLSFLEHPMAKRELEQILSPK